MINLVLEQIREKLAEYLSGYYEMPGEIVELGIPEAEADAEAMNKMLIGLLNIEREPVAGMRSGYQQGERGRVSIQSPAWHLNIYVMLAAFFEQKQYTNGVRILSDALNFFQQHPVFEVGRGTKITLELVSLNMQELANVWSILGGRYYPSVIFKLRMLTFDGNEITQMTTKISKTE